MSISNVWNVIYFMVLHKNLQFYSSISVHSRTENIFLNIMQELIFICKKRILIVVPNDDS